MKADLLENEDFKAYQDDLRKRLSDHVRTLQRIISEPIGTIGESETKLMRMEATRALIVEYEIILGIPVSYLKDEVKISVEKQRGAATFMEMFRAIFARENP